MPGALHVSGHNCPLCGNHVYAPPAEELVVISPRACFECQSMAKQWFDNYRFNLRGRCL